MACYFVADNGADHCASCSMTRIAVTDFMLHHAAHHAAQDDRRGGSAVMARIIIRLMMPTIISRCGCTVVIEIVVTMVVEMPRLVPPAMLARMVIMPLDVRLAIDRTRPVITVIVPRLRQRWRHHDGQDNHGGAQ